MRTGKKENPGMSFSPKKTWNKIWIYLTRRAFYGRNTVALRHREEFPFLLNNLRLTGIGVEIGVFEGYFSELLLQLWKGRLLLSIDPYREYSDAVYPDVLNTKQAMQDQIYEGTRQRLAGLGGRSLILRGESLEVARLIPPGSMDFVYVDGNHSYPAVLADLQAWYSLLVPGGLMAGDDWKMPDVQKAVKEFCSDRGLELKMAGNLSDPDNFYFFKPLGR